METLSYHLDPDQQQRIGELASKEARSPEVLVHEAIDEYLFRHDKRAQFIADAQASQEHFERTGLHLTHEEVSAWIDCLIAGEDVPMPECHT